MDLDNSGILHFIAKNRIRERDAPKLFELVQLLAEKQMDLNLQNIHGATALHEAAARDNLLVVRALVEHNAKIDIQAKCVLVYVFFFFFFFFNPLTSHQKWGNSSNLCGACRSFKYRKISSLKEGQHNHCWQAWYCS